MMTRLKKEKQVKALEQNMQKAKAGFLVDFQGLKVQDLTNLRKELRAGGLSDIQVGRNTLIKKALSFSPEISEHINPYLSGSNALVFAFKEPSRTAKILSNYVKDTEFLQIKTGVLEGRGLALKDIKTLANLPSLEVLQAQFLSVLSAPLSKCLALFSAVPQGLLTVLSAKKDSATKDSAEKGPAKQEIAK